MSEFLALSEGLINCPRGDGQGIPIVINVASLLRAQSRINDIAIANSHNSKELLKTFNISWLHASRAVSAITAEKVKAENYAKRAHAESLLRANAEECDRRGFKPSADVRKAIAELDPIYIKAKERLDIISAALHYMQDKKQAFENAFTSVKKLANNMAPPLMDLTNGKQGELE